MIPTDSPLCATLRQDHTCRARLHAGTCSLALLAAALLLLPLLFAAEALLIFPPALRAALGLLWIALLPAALLWRARLRKQTFHPEASALALQTRGALQEDELLVALDLEKGGRPGTSEALRKASVARAETLAAALTAANPPDPRPLRLARRVTLAAVALPALLALLFPAVPAHVLPRFLQPWADHPPYTRLTFSVQQTPEPVAAHQDAQVRVRIEGPGLPDLAELVFPDLPEGPQRLRMLRETAAEDDPAATFALRLPRVAESASFYIDTPRGRSRRYPLTVSFQPQLQAAWLRITPPAYTGWPTRETRVTSPTLTALAGSEVTLLLDANLPLDTSRLDWDHPPRHADPGPLPMPPLSEPSTRATVTWTATVEDHLQAWLISAQGETAAVPFSATFQPLADQPPEIHITAPEAVAVVPEDWTVDLAIVATDDIGIGRIDVTLRTADSHIVQPVTLPENRQNPARTEVVHSLDLQSLGARAGDRIRYFATAWDNHPHPPQSADSPVGTLQVISRQEYDDFMRQQYRIEDWLEEVAEILSMLHRLGDEKNSILAQLESLEQQAADQPNADLSREFQSARARLDRHREDTAALTRALEDRAAFDQLYDWETPYRDWLKETAQQLQKQQSAAQQLSEHLTPDRDPADRHGARESWAELTDPFQSLPPDPGEVGDQWEQALEAMRMLEAAQRLQQLIEAQQDLADRLAATRGLPDSPERQERLRRLAEAQHHLQEELNHIQQALREAADGLQESQPDLAEEGRQLAQTLDTLQVGADQARANREALAADPQAATAAAQRAADSLASLAGACEAQCDAAGQCLSSLLNLTPPGLHPAMQQAMMDALTARPGISLGQTGRQGAGSGGQMSTVGMIGPQYPLRGQSVSLRSASASRRGGEGQGTEGGTQPPETAQELQPDTPPEASHRAPALQTIPPRYRPHAAAYFDRLTRDESPTEN